MILSHLGNIRVSHHPDYNYDHDTGQWEVTYEMAGVIDYYPYGKHLRSWFAEKPDRFQTTENERDVESGLDYRMARYYDAEYGRFMAIDPLAGSFPGWSPYNYVMGNPVGLVDREGAYPKFPKNFSASLAIINYDLNIFRALVSSNNTSPNDLFEYSHGRSIYQRNSLVGAIGEANALNALGKDPLPWVYKLFFKNKYNFGEYHNGYQVDIMHTIQTGTVGDKRGFFPSIEGMYALRNFGFNGNERIPRLLSGNSIWNINYEVKTLNPYSGAATIFRSLSKGISQTIARGGILNLILGF